MNALIRGIVGIVVVPLLMFQMAGGLRTAWPGMLLSGLAGLAVGYLLWGVK